MSLELRLTSPGDQRLRWLAGVYFADIERHVVVSQGSDNTGASLEQNFQARGFVPTGGPNPTDLLYDDTFDSKVYAGFGQIAYDIVDNVELALAVRYDSEKREVDNNVPTGPVDSLAQTPLFAAIYGPTPFINPAYTVNPAFATDGIPSRSRTFDQFQPKLSLNWNVSDDVAVYASYGYGFRSGGFNSSGSQATVDVFYGGLCLGPSTPFDTGLGFDVPLGLPACTADSVRNLTDVNDDYRKEVSKAAEIGFKSTLLDRTLAINGAIYQTDVEDMQFFNFMAGPFGLLRVVTNLDEVSIQGAEVDFNWRANDYFSLFGGIGFTDGEIDRYDGRPYTAGNKLPYSPEYTGNAGVEADDADGRLRPRARRARRRQLRRRDLVPPGAERDRAEPADRASASGRATTASRSAIPTSCSTRGSTLHGERWRATAWGRNLADKEYLQEVIVAPEFGGAFIHDSPGLSYGLDVAYTFKGRLHVRGRAPSNERPLQMTRRRAALRSARAAGRAGRGRPPRCARRAPARAGGCRPASRRASAPRSASRSVPNCGCGTATIASRAAKCGSSSISGAR